MEHTMIVHACEQYLIMINYIHCLKFFTSRRGEKEMHHDGNNIDTICVPLP